MALLFTWSPVFPGLRTTREKEYRKYMKAAPTQGVMDDVHSLTERIPTTAMRWCDGSYLQLFLETGEVVSVKVQQPTGRHFPYVDRVLCNELQATVTAASMENDVVLIALTSSELLLVDPKQSQSQLRGGTDQSFSDAKLLFVPTKGVPQDIHWNCKGNMVVVEFLHSLSLYSVSREKGVKCLKLLTTLQVEGTVMYCRFSQQKPYVLYVVEDGEERLVMSAFDYSQATGTLVRSASVLIRRLPRVTCFSWDLHEELFLISRVDGTMSLYRHNKAGDNGASLVGERGEQLPDGLYALQHAWHPSGALFVVFTNTGAAMCYDRMMSQLTFYQADGSMTDVHSCVDKPVDVSQVTLSPWGVSHNPETMDSIAFRFSGCGMGVLSLSMVSQSRSVSHIDASSVAEYWLSQHRYEELLRLLGSYPFHHGLQQTVTLAIDQLLLGAETHQELEGSECVGMVLGMFWKPSVNDLKFRRYIETVYRRYFYHLLRNQNIESAFVVANRLNSPDLYWDLFVVTNHLGETVPADISYTKFKAASAQEGSTALPDAILDRQHYTEVLGHAPEASKLEHRDWDSLDKDESCRLGLWLESKGRLHDALELYKKAGNFELIDRMNTLLQALDRTSRQFSEDIKLNVTRHT